MEILVLVVVGKMMIGPQLCQIDYFNKGQIYTIEEKCQENSIPHTENPGTL